MLVIHVAIRKRQKYISYDFLKFRVFIVHSLSTRNQHELQFFANVSIVRSTIISTTQNFKLHSSRIAIQILVFSFYGLGNIDSIGMNNKKINKNQKKREKERREATKKATRKGWPWGNDSYHTNYCYLIGYYRRNSKSAKLYRTRCRTPWVRWFVNSANIFEFT